MPLSHRIAWSVFSTYLVALVLFLSAGQLTVVAFWAYVGIFAATCVAGIVLADPDLWTERLSPKGMRLGVFYAPLGLPLLAHWIVAGLDRGHFHWSRVPLAAEIAALVALALAFALTTWAAAVNRYLSSVVRLQDDRGHTIVTTGPYAFVRHPTYLGALLMILASGLALGSWVAAPLLLLYLPALAFRTIREDRFLKAKLEGYAAYADRVRWRLVPGVF
jgi:protein-S-isoprenylcysteine O-methyltransferase Ste14